MFQAKEDTPKPYNEMFFKVFVILIGLWHCMLCAKNICEQEPVKIDEEFIGCCHGKPVFTSESCVDALYDNDTFTQECLIACLYEDLGIYDGHSINMTSVEQFFGDNVVDNDMRLMFVSAFEHCTKFDRKSLAELLSFIDLDSNNGCDVYPTYMDRCIWYHTLSYCPKRHSTDTAICIDKQRWVQDCLLERITENNQ